ncbi:MAG TPA: hypothetical protein VG650_05235 [Mycobacteriales bacterium]|nr:hypothetical protein [Mycobacteriales bacterium]HWC34214.1 hypothetical protein [Mycobacteriales bacterium]
MRRQAARAGAGLLVAAAAALSSAAPAAASSSPVPFTDPSTHGYIALCDLAGNNVTGGSINSTPLVWKAVSSTPAPAGFRGKGQNAALFIYQARQGVPPAEWSGDTLSADSFYKNRHHPAAEMTYKDLSLADIIKEFPPLWNGLYQLRMHVGKLNYATYGATYPATVIKVTGSTWHVVSGGTLPCGSSTKAKSSELFAGQPLLAPTPDKNQTPPTAPASIRAAVSSSTGQSAGAVYSATTTSTADAGNGGSSYTTAFVVGAVALALAAAGGGMFFRRRMNSITT